MLPAGANHRLSATIIAVAANPTVTNAFEHSDASPFDPLISPFWPGEGGVPIGFFAHSALLWATETGKAIITRDIGQATNCSVS